MTVFSGVVVYVLVWWVVLFAVLPWGVRPPRDPVPGHATGAPDKPRLLFKFALTTVISIVIWVVIAAVIDADLISFRQMAG